MQHDEERKIIQGAAEFQKAWNDRNEKLIAGFFTPDCLRIGSFGETQHGRKEVETAYRQLIREELPTSTLEHKNGLVRFLSNEIATWQAPFDLFSPGAKTLKGYTLIIVKKTEGLWLIDEMHVKIIPGIEMQG